MESNPEQHILQSVKRFNQRITRLTELSKRLALIRLSIFLVSLITFFFFFALSISSGYWITLFVFIFVFGILTGIQNKIDSSIARIKLWVTIKESNISRLNINWQNITQHNKLITDNDHPFLKDLDIAGHNSLLHLIDNTISDQGYELLFKWLSNYNPEYDEIIQRQKFVKELISETRFRDKFQLQFMLTSKHKLDGNGLYKRLVESNSFKSVNWIFRVLLFVAPVNFCLFILYLLFDIPAYFAVTSLLYIAIHFFNLRYISELFEKAESLFSVLGKFSNIFEFIENNPTYKSKNVLALCSVFRNSGTRPSGEFKKLNRILYALSFQKNPFFELLLNLLFPWDFYFALRFEKVKNEIKDLLPDWLDVCYKLDALIALANFGWLNPDYKFPEIVKSTSEDKDVFSARLIGHPLIPKEQKILNDYSIKRTGEVAVITGCNMSGKSTFLKTLGINLTLAYAGAPVNADEMITPVFRLFTSLKINDSVTDGVSFFYAEVKRLKFLLDELNAQNSVPLFFLVDEIFRGTNNIERLTGSKSYVKAITNKNGCGLISTHDLELIKLESELSSVRNYHFREDVKDGKMIFDYKLRPGPCPTTNALKIMQMEGLPIKVE